MNRVLVTGATGFLGKHLVETLRANGADLVAAVRPESMVNCGNLRTVPFDLERPDELQPEQLHGVATVYHLAARVHVMRVSADAEHQFERDNSFATEVLARTAAAAGVRRFIYVSSIKVNGERTFGQPFTARDTPSPQDAYGKSKLAAEQALFEIANSTAVEMVIVRPPLVYGPGVGANFRRMIGLVNSNFPLPFGSVANRRSLVSAWNLVDFLVHAASMRAAAGKVWLVSDGKDLSTPSLLELVSKGLGKRSRLLRVPVGALRVAGTISGRRAEIDRLIESLQVDISATRDELHWQPPLDVEEGIARTIAWYKAACNVG